jgi:hypothetical protein
VFVIGVKFPGCLLIVWCNSPLCESAKPEISDKQLKNTESAASENTDLCPEIYN